MSIMPSAEQKRETDRCLKRRAEYKRKYLVTEWGVWHPDEGLVYTAPDKTMCNDHINSGLDDPDLIDFAKKCRLVEVTYHRPAEIES